MRSSREDDCLFTSVAGFVCVFFSFPRGVLCGSVFSWEYVEHHGSMRTFAVAPECMVVVDEDRDMAGYGEIV